MLRMRHILAGLTILVLALTVTALAAFGKVSHAGWPHISPSHLHFAKPSGSHLVGTHKSDELLGQGGSDTLDGNGGSDVLWGDQKPGKQPATQHDVINGGDGNDFIYTSHGFNTVDAGAGNDQVHAHFGQGSIDCGPGTDLLFLSHKSQKHFKIHGCERITYRSSL
jgi:RTX calcium-binding nonapeptide repeat (4 copies)